MNIVCEIKVVFEAFVKWLKFFSEENELSNGAKNKNYSSYWNDTSFLQLHVLYPSH